MLRIFVKIMITVYSGMISDSCVQNAKQKNIV